MSSEFGAIKFSCGIKVNLSAGLWLHSTALLTVESIFSFFRQFIGFVYFDLIACGISQTLACHFRKPQFPVCMDGWMEASKKLPASSNMSLPILSLQQSVRMKSMDSTSHTCHSSSGRNTYGICHLEGIIISSKKINCCA